jgi:hypothetical protein
MTRTPVTRPSLVDLFGDVLPPVVACPACGNTDTTQVELIDVEFDPNLRFPEVYCSRCERYYSLASLPSRLIAATIRKYRRTASRIGRSSGPAGYLTAYPDSMMKRFARRYPDRNYSMEPQSKANAKNVPSSKTREQEGIRYE